MVEDISQYERFTLRDNGPTVQAFIKRFGLPSRYFVSPRPKGKNMLVYDLPSGHTVVVHAHKPPREIFSFVEIIDPEGQVALTIR